MTAPSPTARLPVFALLLLAVAAAPPPSAYLGIAARPATPADAAAAGLPDGVGLTVAFVEPAGPAAVGHAVVAGDVLQKLDDQLLVNVQQMATLVRLRHPGDAVMLTRIRDGQAKQVTITLGERPHAVPPPQAGGDDERIPTLPGVIGPDPATGRLPDDPQLPLPGNTRTTVAFDDGTYSARVTTDALDHKRMVVRAAGGRQVAAGPVDTVEQWNAFPADVRRHLQAVRDLLDGEPRGATRP